MHRVCLALKARGCSLPAAAVSPARLPSAHPACRCPAPLAPQAINGYTWPGIEFGEPPSCKYTFFEVRHRVNARPARRQQPPWQAAAQQPLGPAFVAPKLPASAMHDACCATDFAFPAVNRTLI